MTPTEVPDARTTVTIVGAGQAGLAMSRCLSDLSVDHVVLERGEVANSWATERWDSLRLLTPNWMTRLPGAEYDGDDVDGYETADAVVEHLRRYGRSFDTPVHEHTTVESVRRIGECFVTRTNRGDWTSGAVVIASGGCSTPHIPACSGGVPSHIKQLSPIHYRNPQQLPEGKVIVVGASASGVQLADELARARRDITICVGSHKRLPRNYRGHDVLWWMDRTGQLDELAEQQADLRILRTMPSMQLIGTPEGRTLDLNALSARGVQLAGRFEAVTDAVGPASVQLGRSLADDCHAADLDMHRLLGRIDDFIEQHGLTGIAPPDVITPTVVGTPPSSIDLSDVGTIIWATGFRPDYPWLDPEWLDERGAIRHHLGVMDEPGMFVLGLPFLRRRKSNFIDGVGLDAVELADRLVAGLASAPPIAVSSG